MVIAHTQEGMTGRGGDSGGCDGWREGDSGRCDNDSVSTYLSGRV